KDVQAAVVDKPRGTRKKRKAASGASGSNLPLKNLKEDHDTSGDTDASTAGKSLTALQGLLERSTLAAEVGVVAVATVPFVTSSMTLTPEREGNAEVTFIARSPIPPPPVVTAAVAGIAPVLGVGTESAIQSIFHDFASSSVIYVPKWNVINDSALDDPEVCRNMINQLAPSGFFSQLRGMDYDQLFAEFNVGAARQTCLSAEVSQVSVVEVAEAARVSQLNSLKGRTITLEAKKSTLEGQIAALKSAAITKDTELADNLTDQVSLLETTCSGLYDQLSSYKLFKERYEAVQDEYVKILSDHAVDFDFELMGMAVDIC
nr:hypothetical protein [Tanacetum cinerariifolium]